LAEFVAGTETEAVLDEATEVLLGELVLVVATVAPEVPVVAALAMVVAAAPKDVPVAAVATLPVVAAEPVAVGTALTVD
jgi:hypothetical protein